MKIKQPCVATLTWTLTDTLNEVLDVLAQPREFFVGGGDLLAAVERALLDHQAGDKVRLQIEPEQGFGDFNEQLIFLEPRRLFAEPLLEGMVFEGGSLPAGCQARALADGLYTVTDVYPDHVVLDGNHPLAGIALRLQLHVHAVRSASAAEIRLGSAGGAPFFKVSPQQAQALGNRPLGS